MSSKLENIKYVQQLPLHKYQKQAILFILTHPFAGLFLDVGMGKSLITIAALSTLPKENTLVIAPKNIARSTWIDEIDKWHAPLLYKSLIVNKKGEKLSKKERYKAYHDVVWGKPRVYFLNRDLIGDCIDYFKKYNEDTWPFRYVVIDESQSFKSYNSQRFKKLKQIRSQITRLIELTGTPTPNGLMDLWPQIYLLDGGKSLGSSISEYRMAFFKAVKFVNSHPVKWEPLKIGNYNAEQDIYNHIRPYVISMKNTALQLPPVTYAKDKVYLDDTQRAAYEQMKKKHVLPITTEKSILANNAAVLVGKLSQMASGALYVDDDKNYLHIHDEKLKRVEYIINNTPTPVLIAYHFKSDLDMMQKYFQKNKIGYHIFDGSTEMVRNWNARKYHVMLIQPASSGAGLNLQKGGHTLVWYTMPWSLEQYIQMNGRLARQGQTEPVVIHHIITANTIDERILSALKHKDMSQKTLMAAVRFALNIKK